MIPSRYDVTDVVAARRRTRPPTALFVAGLVAGWVLDVVVIVLTVQVGWGVLTAVVAGILGYFVLPVPIVTALREVWLRTHRDRRAELDRQLGDHVPGLRSWVDDRTGGSAGLPPDLATTWLLRPEPASAHELLPLPPELTWQVGGAALAARHETVDGRTLLRLAVLPSATDVTDGPEPPPL
ncbi:hypothetical protein ACXR2U_03915 [Jatrophihabitans sp. YIM 134969]